jgi:hypothetical protein
MAETCTACGRDKDEHAPGVTFHNFTTDPDADGARDPNEERTVTRGDEDPGEEEPRRTRGW